MLKKIRKGDFVMYYKNELAFFCDTLSKKHIKNQIITSSSKLSEIFSQNFAPFCSAEILDSHTLESFVDEINENTIYNYVDSLELSYVYMLLPDSENNSILFIGPFKKEAFSKDKIAEICKKNDIDKKSHGLFEKLLDSFPIIEADGIENSMIETLGEVLWGKDNFEVVDIAKNVSTPASPIIDEFDEVMVDMKKIESRYEIENALIEAVKHGHIYKANQLLAMFTVDDIEHRSNDSVRNGKNYCIIMNTLLRKSAESGGVHPIYLDSVSSAFAKRIELIPSLKDIPTIMEEMVRSYCRLVRKHSINEYTPLVQKTIISIDSNISAPLSLSILAREQKVSPGYLSTVFKKETGKSVTEYIRDKRIRHAAHLLATTHLQIQTVAQHCGIPDVQYFSKLFKKEIGKPPKEYREAVKKG